MQFSEEASRSKEQLTSATAANQPPLQRPVTPTEVCVSDPKKPVAPTKNENLPMLPLPLLQQTLKKYEKKMEVLIEPDDRLRLKRITKQFLDHEKLGPHLQEYLLNRRKKLKNWAYEYRLKNFYLSNRLSLPINSNPSYFNSSVTCIKTDIVLFYICFCVYEGDKLNLGLSFSILTTLVVWNRF
ncbi:hypothetical protein FQA39_LY03921 [Lamprigera yunnana]|nr:hypothetical protein FQA39_LY03921 [Lamprigera yunnana]